MDPSPRIGAVLLAAGQSRRMGHPKQLELFDGEALVLRAARAILGSSADRAVAVVGFQAQAVRGVLREVQPGNPEGSPPENTATTPQPIHGPSLELEIVENPRWPQGQSTSIQAGLDASSGSKKGRDGEESSLEPGQEPDIDAALFVPCDQPLLDSPTLDHLIAAHRTTRAGIVVPTYDGQRGAPVLFGSRFFPLLAKLEGDRGGRSLFSEHGDAVLEVAIADPRIGRDVDTPAELEELRALVAKSSGLGRQSG